MNENINDFLSRGKGKIILPFDEYPRNLRNTYNKFPLNASPGMRRLFNTHSQVINQFEEVSLSAINRVVAQHTKPFFGEFAEKLKEPHFAKIKNDFFRYSFGYPKIYVTFFDFEEALNSELFEDEEAFQWYRSRRFPKGPSMQIWSMEEDGEEEKLVFTHMQTGAIMKTPLDGDDFVVFCYDFEDHTRFEDGYLFAYSYLLQFDEVENNLRLASKNVSIECMEEDVQNAQEEANAVLNNTMPFNRTSLNVELRPNELITDLKLTALIKNAFTGGDRQLAELGRVANTNPKQERLTTGENYKDIVGVANRQTIVLHNLELFSIEIKEKGNLETIFEVSQIPLRVPQESQNMSDNQGQQDGRIEEQTSQSGL